MKCNIALPVLAALGMVLLSAPRAHALPNWSRQYNLKCEACHAPAPPRLNYRGHQFRKLGFRFPEEVGKDPDPKDLRDLGNLFAIRIRPRYVYQSPKTGSTVSEVRINDATPFVAGAITKNLTFFSEFEFDNLEELQGLGTLMYFDGKPNNYWAVRIGQMHTLTRIGFAGFDRPTGISTTEVFAQKLTNTAVPFAVNKDQRGIEFTKGFSADTRLMVSVLNGLNTAGDGTKGTSNGRAMSDFQLAYEHILSKNGSGFTLFGYSGVWRSTAANSATEFKFLRYGATGSWFIPSGKGGKTPWEVQGGYVRARDKFPAASASPTFVQNGGGGYVELEKWFPHETALFGRVERREGGFRTDRILFGGVRNISQHLRLGAELGRRSDRNFDAALEAQFVF